MTNTTKIYLGLAIAGIFAIGILGGAFWSNRQITKLENAVEAARAAALSSQQSAVRKEIEAAEYKQKIEYLEANLKEIQTIARKQDEEIKKHTDNSSHARSDVERVRRLRTINATTDELCAKLDELGHPCE